MARAGSLARPVNSLVETSSLNPRPTRKERREIEHRLLVVQADGMETAARLHVAGYVSDLAMHEVGRISERQALQLQRVPLGAGRFQLVGDTGAMLVNDQLVGLGEAWRRPW